MTLLRVIKVSRKDDQQNTTICNMSFLGSTEATYYPRLSTKIAARWQSPDALIERSKLFRTKREVDI